jgi:hypothetical protein
LKIEGAKKNGTNEIFVEFKTDGTDDVYQKKVIVTEVFNEEEEKPKFTVKIKETATNDHDKTPEEEGKSEDSASETKKEQSVNSIFLLEAMTPLLLQALIHFKEDHQPDLWS